MKIPNASSMLKVTFLDVSIATRALSDGLAISYYYINPRQIEPERFTYITPCWTCYSYSHSTADCHVKNKKICSTCGSAGHDFRSCTSTAAPTCSNCKSDHHTLAAKCPVRKDILSKKLKEETKKPSGTSPTYAAIAKIQSTTSKILQATQQSSPPPLTTQPPPDDISTKFYYCMMFAHMQNAAKPGSFNTTINELLALNNMPSFNFPASPPSAEILKIIPKIVSFEAPDDLKELIIDNDDASSFESFNQHSLDNIQDSTTPPIRRLARRGGANIIPSPPLTTTQMDQSEATIPPQSSIHSVEETPTLNEPSMLQPPTKTSPAITRRINTEDQHRDQYLHWKDITFYTTPDQEPTMNVDTLYEKLLDSTVEFTNRKEPIAPSQHSR
nr:uncharacterized protein LOC128693514 [Cherax quadricarinatus]